jgi:hypothetical protein
MRAAEHYLYTVSPPLIGSASNSLSRTPSGFSYQDDFDIVYVIAGTYARLIDWIPGSLTTKLRSFNVLLFAIMVIGSLRSSRVVVNLPFFILPQVWYTVSYFNGDTLPLFLSWCLVNAVADRLNDPQWRLSSSLYVGLILGALFVSKRNYLICGVFILGLVLYHAFRHRHKIGLLPMCIAAAGIVALRIGPDLMINGIDRSDRVRDAREMSAFYEFKPSTPVEKRYFGFGLAERGVPVEEVLFERGWLVENLFSFIGKYGNMGLKSDWWVYTVFGLALGGGILFLAYRPISGNGVQPDLAPRLLSLWYVAFLCCMVGASLWHTMKVDFQPQGRYLFPCISATVLMLRVGYGDRALAKRGLVLACSGLFFVALHSFVFSYALSGEIEYQRDRKVRRFHPWRYGAAPHPSERHKKDPR